MTGTGVVNASASVCDATLLFNSTASLKQTILWNGLPSQNVTINLDMSTPAKNGALGVGWTGNGSLTIQNGVTVTSNGGYLGYNSGSTGSATVDGAGSTWTGGFPDGGTYVGTYGSGARRSPTVARSAAASPSSPPTPVVRRGRC